MNPLIPLKGATPLFFIALALLYFAILPKAQAVIPSPDGGYPGGNTAEGQAALFSLTTGGFNTAIGFFSLRSDTIGSFNTGVGAGTLLANTGDQNTATGAGALLSNISGSGNTADGAFALFSNTTGFSNTANGVSALFSNTTGEHNTAAGVSALGGNTTGRDNTANGAGALLSNTTGNDNTAIGSQALFSNTIGIGNIALGASAGITITTGSNNIHIGHVGDAPDSDTIRIGQTQTRTFIGGIFGQTTAGAAIPVLIDAASQLGTQSSSRRFKKEIKPMDQVSESIHALKPVTFHYKSDSSGTPQFGLIAEEVAEVNPDLVVRDKNGEIYTVRYDAVDAMLLNEFLKEHRKVEEQSRKLQEQESTIEQQRKDFERAITELRTRIETVVSDLKVHDSKIQKVTAQIELSKPGGQTALNDP